MYLFLISRMQVTIYFSISTDTGIGSEYKVDIACLKLIELPLLIHDSLLFTNIEMDRVENIIRLYSSLKKQVFILIDRTEKLDKEVQKNYRITPAIEA